MNPKTDDKKGVRRTALILAAVAIAIYVGFILSGVLNA
ncbi:MAG: cytochrome oxidase small assembly protein [Woeseiaceae bacterium]